jgi:hypothetical protein
VSDSKFAGSGVRNSRSSCRASRHRRPQSIPTLARIGRIGSRYLSWGATGLGVAAYVVNLVIAGVTGNQWNAAKIDKLAIDWKTGSIVMVGGLIRGPIAFDLGNFVFMNPHYVDGSTPDRTYDAVLRHETGHTLEVAAFGTAFLVADFIGENVVGAGANDYGEKIAESHANRSGYATIPMWG